MSVQGVNGVGAKRRSQWGGAPTGGNQFQEPLAQCDPEQCWHMPPVPWPHLCLVLLPGHWVPVPPAPRPPLGTCAMPRWGRPGAVASPRWPPLLSYRTGSAPSRYGSPGGSWQPGCGGREPSLRDPTGARVGPMVGFGYFCLCEETQRRFQPWPGLMSPVTQHHQTPTWPGCQGYGWASWGHRARDHWGSPCSAGVALRSCWPWMSSLTAASQHRSST